MELYEIEGFIVRLIYENEHSEYRVYLFKLDDASEKQLVINGNMPVLTTDIKYILYGTYQEHHRYGMQFNVESYRTVMPHDASSVVKFLSSSQFPGIGIKTAEKLVDMYGHDILERITSGEEVYISPSVISERNQQVLFENLQKFTNLEEAMMFFQTTGVGIKTIMKIDKVYGKDAISIISENPYKLIDDISGVGFKTADNISTKLGFGKDHPYRLKALMVYETMQLCMQTGSTYTTREDLLNVLEKHHFTEEIFNEILDEAVSDKRLMIEEVRIYHHTQYDAEVTCAQYFKHMPYLTVDPLDIDLDELITQYEQKWAIEYDISQKQAIKNFFNKDKNIITGGPGTGKTTIIQAIIALFRECYPQYEIAICAPTGRAAKRLKEIVNLDVTTIHSLIKWDLETNTFGHNETNPILCDVLIIDEFSMVDSWTMAALCKATPKVRKILFIGDKDQLPSVSPGFLIRDLLNSNEFVVNTLMTNYRQARGSQIIELANQVREGEFSLDLCHGEVGFIEANKHLVTHLLDVVKNALDKGYDISDIQVLAAKYNGNHGIDTLNFMLQKLCNPPSPSKREIKVGYQLFREGDKMLQLKNQADDHVFNGDIGQLVEITYKEENYDNKMRMVVDFEGTIVEYTPDQFINLKHAYCMSVHKAQGSEYPIVIIVATKQHQFMMQRRLLYTAITRASRALILMGQETVYAHGANNETSMNIKTTLNDRMSMIDV